MLRAWPRGLQQDQHLLKYLRRAGHPALRRRGPAHNQHRTMYTFSRFQLDARLQTNSFCFFRNSHSQRVIFAFSVLYCLFLAHLRPQYHDTVPVFRVEFSQQSVIIDACRSNRWWCSRRAGWPRSPRPRSLVCDAPQTKRLQQSIPRSLRSSIRGCGPYPSTTAGFGPDSI